MQQSNSQQDWKVHHNVRPADKTWMRIPTEILSEY